MAVRIRLKKTGSKNNGAFRIVVLPQISGRDSRTIDEIGFYDPRRSNEKIDIERYDYWVSQGARPSITVHNIAERERSGKAKCLADFKAVMAEKDAAKPTKRRARKTPVATDAAPAETSSEAPAEA